MAFASLGLAPSLGPSFGGSVYTVCGLWRVGIVALAVGHWVGLVVCLL